MLKKQLHKKFKYKHAINATSRLVPLAGAVEYTDCTSAEGERPPMSVLIWQ